MHILPAKDKYSQNPQEKKGQDFQGKDNYLIEKPSVFCLLVNQFYLSYSLENRKLFFITKIIVFFTVAKDSALLEVFLKNILPGDYQQSIFLNVIAFLLSNSVINSERVADKL